MTNNNDLESVFSSIISEPINKFTPITRNKIQSGELRQLINNEISSGALNPYHTSSFEEEYHIVNLPADYRELEIPYQSQPVYISNITNEIETLLNKGNPEVIARNLDVIHNHLRNTRSFLQENEEQFLKKYNKIEASTEYVRDVSDNYEDKIGQTISNFFIESRRESVKGVIDIERDMNKSEDLLHRCNFDEAEKILDDCLNEVDMIIMNIDFVKAIVGTLEHGGGEFKIPKEISRKFLDMLVNSVKTDENAKITINNKRIQIISENIDESKKSIKEPNNNPSISTSDVSDEVIYLFKEIQGEKKERFLEKQTSDLPEVVCSQDVLYEFESFCSRQTDIVSKVNIQENSPPGFITIKFPEGLDSRSGMKKLRKRALEEYN